MKLKDLSGLIVFDEIPTRYNHQQKIVLTHLLHLDEHILPERVCPIITSKYFAKKFSDHCRQKGAKCYHTLDITEVGTDITFTDIMLSGHKSVQMLLCESKEITRNLMAVIKEGGQLKCIYAGNFLDVRTALFNDTFSSWIKGETLPHLYLNLERCEENPEKQDVDIMVKVFDNVKKILECHSSEIVHMYLPQFGYDNFIYNLACRFPKRITITSDYKSSLNPIIENETLSFSSELLPKAKIILLPGKPPTDSVSICPYTKREKVVVFVIQQQPTALEEFDANPEENCYSLYYKPEPSPFQLQLLCLVFKPKRVHGIIGRFNILSKAPFYLIDLCGNRTPVVGNKKRSRFSDSLRLLTEVKETGRVLSYGPQMTNQKDPARQLYLDDSSSSD